MAGDAIDIDNGSVVDNVLHLDSEEVEQAFDIDVHDVVELVYVVVGDGKDLALLLAYFFVSVYFQFFQVS